jgi:drug/metabolite transporter (DMT)-like permease
VGVLLELYALAHLQLAFVQPLLAGGVLILPLAAHLLLDEPLAPRWFGGSALIVAGVMVLGMTLPPASRTVAPPEPVVLSLTVLGIVVYLLVHHVRTPVLLGVVAGVGLSGSVIFAKLLVTSLGLLRFVELAPVLAALACIGFLAEMSALQRTSPTTIVPLILALTTVLPIVIGRAVLGERWPHPVLTVLGFALTILPALWFVAHDALDAIAAQAPADRPLSHAGG